MNELTPTAQNEIQAAPTFDTSILAGQVSETTIAQYKLHFATYLAFAGSFENAITPATLALWRQHLLETGYTVKRAKKGANGKVIRRRVLDDDGHPVGKQYVTETELVHKQYSVNAINQRMAAVRKLMDEAATQGYIARTLADDFKAIRGVTLKSNKERRNANARTKITAEQMRLITAQPDTDTLAGMMHSALLHTLAGTGLRISELVTMRVNKIEWLDDEDTGRKGWTVAVMGKNRVDEFRAPMSREAYDAIQAWLAVQPVESEYIFTGFSGRGSRNPSTKHISPQGAWDMVKRYAARAGVEHVKPHDFRRFVGTQVVKLYGLEWGKEALGHKSVATTADNYVLQQSAVGVTDGL